MVLPIALAATSVALVVLVSMVGRARSTVSPGSDNYAVERDLPKTVDALSDMYALNELLRLRREALESTGISPLRMANLMRDIQNKTEKLKYADTVANEDHDPRDGSAWK